MEIIKEAVETFFSQAIDPKELLNEQYKRMGKENSDVDWKKVRDNDTLYISSLFDSCEWWRNVGRKRHYLVFLVVPSIIALPSFNGFQERIFSACTWFDNPLRQSLKSTRFEMAVLLAVNESLLCNKVPSEDELEEIVKNVVSNLMTSPRLSGDEDEIESFFETFPSHEKN